MVDIFGKWADVRKAAARPRQSLERFGDGQDLGAELRRLGAQPAPDPTPHGMRIQDLAEMRRNMAAFEPNIAGPGAQAVAKAKLIAEVLPRGASSYPKTAQTTLNTDGGSATTMYHNMRPYQPELEDPSRQMMPQARTQWNKYARLFYKCDAVIPTVVDMLAELSFGEFTLSGDGVEGDIKKDMEASLDACRVQQRLPDMAREYFMLGEAGVHNYFDEEKGYWSYIAIHNPDQLEVIQTPFLPMEPVVEFRPDPTLREILLSQHPMLRELRESLPPEMVAAVIGGRNITLAPNNFTFLARKLHPYEMRGTSILSRLWRILMFEDCFPAGVSVSQPGGTSLPIEALRVGDPVLDRFGRPAVVEAAVVKPGDGVLRRIALADGRVILCTRSQRWPVRGSDGAEVKLEARAIRPGQALMSPADGRFVYHVVAAVDDVVSSVPVYGITVSGDRSYIADGLSTYNSLFNAAIATARRRASPLKVAKIGNDTFMPPPEYGDKVLRMITQSEMDVHSWLVMLNCVQFELVGVQEQVMSINAHYDLIERVKLSALGVSRALINGEANYSASAAGLTIFMQRLQAIRTMFVREWLIPKFFGVLAEAREWVKPTEAEVAHGVRVKRSHQEKLDRGMYIKPNIEWAKSLDSKVDADRANILAQLEQSGIVKFSSRTKYAAVGLDRDIEWRQIKQEAAEARKVAGDDPMVLDRLGYGAPAPEDGGMGGGGGGGAPATLPPLPPGSLGEFGPPADQTQPPPEQAAGVGVSATEDAEASDLAAAGWEADAISAGKRLLKTFDPADAQDTAPWGQVLDSPAVRAAVATGDAQHAWNAIEAWLIGRAYPADVIISLEKALTSRTASSLSKIELEALAAIKAIEAEIGQDGDASI